MSDLFCLCGHVWHALSLCPHRCCGCRYLTDRSAVMTTYRSRPVDVEAMQWHGKLTGHRDPDLRDQAGRIVAWVTASGGEARYETERTGQPFFCATCGLARAVHGGFDLRACDRFVASDSGHPARIAVRTVNGWAYAAPGHYIVMGDLTFVCRAHHDIASGTTVAVRCRDFYPCDPATFEKRWESKS